MGFNKIPVRKIQEHRCNVPVGFGDVSWRRKWDYYRKMDERIKYTRNTRVHTKRSCSLEEKIHILQKGAVANIREEFRDHRATKEIFKYLTKIEIKFKIRGKWLFTVKSG